MKIVFTNNIVSVTVVTKSLHYAYLIGCEYTTKLKCVRYLWGFIPIEFKKVEGFYFKGTMDNYIRKHNVYLEDGKIYNKPYCRIHTCDDNDDIIYFNNINELNKYVDKLKRNGEHIIIE